MDKLILSMLAMPLITGTYLTVGGAQKERRIVRAAFTCGVAFFALALSVIAVWSFRNQHPIDVQMGDLYSSDGYRFSLSFFVDSMGCLWLFMISFFSNVIFHYSRVYLHQDRGFQRFYACLMFMIFGLTLLVVSGNLDLFLAGWEFVGICSFLLIGFYQYRTMPVRNAFTVYSVYRFCDVGLLLGAWLSHVLWHDSQSFFVLRSSEIKAHLADVGPFAITAMAGLILLAASGKSAQFPFTFWLSRALEGPTPSSAIFYGALSVHAGVLLLYRTHPIWNAFWLGPYLVAGTGLLTAMSAMWMSRVQSNIKGQIAYSSAAHVGLMFIELALGLKSIVMLHMFCNASLRCYQLLVSPSVVNYLLRLQQSASNSSIHQRTLIEHYLPKRLHMTLYVYALNDAFLEPFVRTILWQPIVSFGRILKGGKQVTIWVVLLLSVSGSLMMSLTQTHASFVRALISTFIMVGASAVSLAEKRSPMAAWMAVGFSNVAAAVCVWQLESHVLEDVILFLCGIAAFWCFGFFALRYFYSKYQNISLQRYQGLGLGNRRSALALLVACLGISGFPVGPVFIGQDVLLHHAVDDFVWLAFALAFVFSINGLSAIRIYARICLGAPSSFKSCCEPQQRIVSSD